MHCHGRQLLTRNPIYVAGFEFLPQPVGNFELIIDVLEKLAPSSAPLVRPN